MASIENNQKYQNEASRRALAEQIAREGIVLLRNEKQILPLNPLKSLAVFGRGQLETQVGGMGSGASDGKNTSTIIDGLKSLGFHLDEELLEHYQGLIASQPRQDLPDFMKLITSGIIYEIWGKYQPPAEEFELPESIISTAARRSDTALFVITRNSGGEECDRKIEGDYYLQPSENLLLKQLSEGFKQVVVVLNINGLIDTSWVTKYDNIDGLLFAGLPGEGAGIAIAELLAGKCTPSGKLPSTMALSYDDYPTAKHFSFNKDVPESILTYQDYGLDAAANGSTDFDKSPVTVYQEGIYVGYRYFDTFGKEVLYPFGYGLSYTDFTIQFVSSSFDLKSQSLLVSADVTNAGTEYSGMEVVQLYISEPEGKLEKPYQKLVGYGKTKELKPGQKETVTLEISIRELASYDEERAAYVLEAGDYLLRMGSSSRNTRIVGKVNVDALMIVQQLSNKLELHSANAGKVEFLSKKGTTPITYEGEAEQLLNAPLIGRIVAADLATEDKCTMASTSATSIVDQQRYSLADVRSNRITMEQFVSQLNREELAVLVNGHGKGVPFGGIGLDVPDTIQYEDGSDIGVNTHPTGSNNYVSPGISRVGIPSILYQDGPAGVRMLAWPVQTVQACTWNKALLYDFGDAAGTEAALRGVDSWLAPAVNLHRNPIGGRNYEYYSEDPLLSGECAVAMANGVQENHNVTVCAKHFALNEQETYRRGNGPRRIDAVDSIVQERTAREIFLKPFEMLVRRTAMKNIMTSFNKINGVFAAGSRDLNTSILREEWGFQGFVVTDWGDMDTVVHGADAVHAGNDIIMPGGPPVIRQVLEGLSDGRCMLEDLKRNAAHLLEFVMHSKAYEVYEQAVDGESAEAEIAATK